MKYTVQKNDTVWELAELFLKDSLAWKDVWHFEHNDNPDLIFPGDIISRVKVDGADKLTINRRVKIKSPKILSKSKQYTGSHRNIIKKSPQITQVASENAILPIPMQVLNVFLNPHEIIPSKKKLKTLPKVVGLQKERLIALVGDKVYARGDFPPSPKNYYRIYRTETSIRDPDTKKFIGILAKVVGDAYLTKKSEVSTLKIYTTEQSIRVGDHILLNEGFRPPLTFFPKRVNKKINGKIVYILNGAQSAFMYSNVVINKGAADKLKAGDLVTIYNAENSSKYKSTNNSYRRKYKLEPDEKIGYLLIYRVYDNASSGVILSSSGQITIGDYINP